MEVADRFLECRDARLQPHRARVGVLLDGVQLAVAVDLVDDRGGRCVATTSDDRRRSLLMRLESLNLLEELARKLLLQCERVVGVTCSSALGAVAQERPERRVLFDSRQVRAQRREPLHDLVELCVLRRVHEHPRLPVVRARCQQREVRLQLLHLHRQPREARERRLELRLLAAAASRCRKPACCFELGLLGQTRRRGFCSTRHEVNAAFFLSDPTWLRTPPPAATQL